MLNLKYKFGKRLKELREEHKMSQEQFAELIGISPRNLSKIETGITFPSSKNLEKIFDNLDCAPSLLFDFNHIESKINMQEKIYTKIKSLNEKQLKLIYILINLLN